MNVVLYSIVAIFLGCFIVFLKKESYTTALTFHCISFSFAFWLILVPGVIFPNVLWWIWPISAIVWFIIYKYIGHRLQ